MLSERVGCEPKRVSGEEAYQYGKPTSGISVAGRQSTIEAGAEMFNRLERVISFVLRVQSQYNIANAFEHLGWARDFFGWASSQF